MTTTKRYPRPLEPLAPTDYVQVLMLQKDLDALTDAEVLTVTNPVLFSEDDLPLVTVTGMQVPPLA